MSWLTGLQISGSGLRASSLRMEVIAENLANAEATRTPEGGAYQRQEVLLASAPLAGAGSRLRGGAPRAAQIVGIVPAAQPTRRVYEPGHPDADPEGYVTMPNVDVPMEMADLTAASRAYQANAAAFSALRRSTQELLSLLG